MLVSVFVGLLGPFELRNAQRQSVAVGGPRLRMLLARLALDAGRSVAAEALIDDLWGQQPPSGAVNALQSLVSRVRRCLPEPTALRSGPAGYALVVDPERIDTFRFDRLLARGHALLGDQRFDPAARTFAEALDCWRGEPLVDLADAPFAPPHVARLAEQRLSAWEGRLEAELNLGRPRDAVAELDALCARHPLRERFAALRMRALHEVGRRADALRTYADIRSRLAEELGVDPGAELHETYLAVLRADEAPRPAPPSGPPGNLSSFVGREVESAQVEKALADSRLVTLFGPGGAGKTRLATEVTARVRQRVVFAELGPVRDGQDVAAAVLSALGVRESWSLEGRPSTDVVSRLIDLLDSESTVLVLDNCEHVITAAAELVHALTSRCRSLHVVATSREPLALPGETLLAVGPLGLPGEDDDPRVAAAVRLFTQRAEAARPGFSLAEHNIDAVVEICRRLDGMPLALELAAARLRGMSVEQVAARLDDRFRLLTNGHRTSMPQHRTLWAVVEWSWELLDDRERLLAARMSVFAAGARAESISAVCAGADIEPDDVVYVLASLVEKSFVEVVDSGAEVRYRMLETVRAHCARRLDDPDPVLQSYLDHFLELAEQACPALHGAEQLTWIARLDAEHDNLLAVLHHLVSAADSWRAHRLVAALIWYWMMSMPPEETDARLAEVLALPGPAPAESRSLLGVLRAFVRPADVGAMQDEVRLLRDSRAVDRYPAAALAEPVAWLFSGETAEFEASVTRIRAHPDPWANAAGLFVRGFAAEFDGDWAASAEHARAAASAFRAVGDRWGTAQAIGSLAQCHSVFGDGRGTLAAWHESLEVVRELGSPEDLMIATVRMAMELVRFGEAVRAREMLTGALDTSRSRLAYHRAFALGVLAEAERSLGNRVAARAHLDEAAQFVDQLALEQDQQRAHLRILQVRSELDGGDPGAARHLLADSCPAELAMGEQQLCAVVAEHTAMLLHREQRSAEAAEMLGVAVALRGIWDAGDPDLRALIDDLDALLGPEMREAAIARTSHLTHQRALAVVREELDR